MRALTAILIAALASPGPVLAQSSELPPNIAGLWIFEAQVHEVCTFDGQARVIPTADPAHFACELTAQQDCPIADVRYVVEQSCEVDIDDGVATVISTIQTFLEGEPSENYLPDNFQLVIEDESTLSGVLIGSGAYPAEWRRAEGAIS